MQNQNTPPQNNPFSGSYNTGEDMVAYEPLSPGSAVSPQAQNLNQSIIQEVPDDGVLESDYIAQQKAQPAPSISNPIPSQSYSMPDFHTSGRDIGNKFMYIVGFALIAFILLIGGGFLVFNKAGNSVVKSPDIEVPEQAVDLGEIVQTTDELSTIKPSQNAKTVILNGDVISTGSVSLYQNGNQGKISLGQIDNNQNYTLPNSSGVFCLDSNNCNFADVNNVVNSIGGVNGILALGGGLSIQGNTLISAIGEAGITTSINSLIGQISIQGTSNQVNVATSSNVITLTTPQSIATSSSPTFQTITLATPGTQNGNIICDISNNCGYAGGGNAFVQNGNSFGEIAILGTNDNYNLEVHVNGSKRLEIDSSTGGTSVWGELTVNKTGSGSIVRGSNIQVSTTASGTVAYGQYIRVDTADDNASAVYGQRIERYGASSTSFSSYGLEVTSLNAPTSSVLYNYGINVQDQTNGTNDYGIAIGGADTYALWVGSGADNTDSANGITFGLSGDTNLFRAAANVLETADSLIVDDRLQIGVGNSSNTINQCQDIAIVNCTAGIELSVSSTQTINKTFGIYNQTLINPGALNSADNYASANYLILHGSQNYTGVNGGVLGQAFIIDMGGDVDNIAGVVGIAGSTNGNVGDAHGLYGSVFQYGGTGLIDNAYSIFASTGSGNITNNYGLFIENQYAVGSGENYNIFSQGQGYNLLQGHTAIGSTAQINGGGSDNIILHVAETVDSSLAGSDYGVDIAVTSDPSISGGGAVVGLRSLVETSATATQDDGWIIGIQGHASHASDQTIGAMYGIYGYSSVDFGSTGDAGLLAGTVGQVDHWGSGTVSSAASIFGITKNGSTGTINQASGGYLQVTNEGTGTIDSAYGLIVDNPTNNGTLTLNVGIAVNSMTSGDTDVGISLGTAEDYTLVISADADNTTANAGIFFGISADTNLYRGGTNQLNTDSSMDIAGHTAIGADAAVNDTNLINNASTYSTVLTIEEEFTDLTSTDQVSGIVNYIQATPASTATAGVYGIDNRIATSGANDLADITGIYSVVSHAGTGLAGNVYGQYISALNESTSGGVGNLVGSGVGTTNQDVTSAIYGQILTAVNVGTNSGTTNGQVVQAQNHGTDAGLIGQSIDVRNIGTTDVLSGLTVSVANSGTISSGLSYGIVVTSANTASLHLSSEVDSTTQGGGIVFGSSRDTNLYRGAANVLTTDDIFAVGTLGTANTATYLCRNGSLQISTCDTTIGGAAFVHGGNSFGSTAIFGTQDDNDIAIIVGNNQAVLIADEGAVTFQNEVDTTSGFSILDADGGNPVLNVDTTNERVGIGTATPSYSLDVVGDANFSSSLQIGESVDVGTISQCLTVLGLAPCKAGLDVAERSSEDSSPSYGIHNIMIVNPAGDSTAVNLGIQTELIVGNATTQNFSGLSIADKAKLWGGTTGTISYGWGVSGEVTNTLAGTITEAVAVRGAVDQIGAGTINTAVALQAASGAYSAGTVDNNYGIWAQAQNTSATNDYGVRIDTAQTQTLWIAGDQANPTTSSQGIAFGSSRDVDLYRSASNTLRTSDSLIIDTNLGVNNTSAPNRVNVNTLTTADPDAELAVSTGADDKKGIIVQAVSGQTANLQEWQDDAGAALASISATGDLYVKNAFVDGDLLIKGHITALNPNGDTTTVVAGAGAGTGASATVTGSDVAGYVVVNTGTGSGTGTLATVTFANAHGSGIYGPSIVLTPKNGNGATIQYFASTSSQTTFTIDSNNAPTDSTTYEYYYHVIAFDLSD